MPEKTKLEEVLHCTLESLKEKEYSTETLSRYQIHLHKTEEFSNPQMNYSRSISVTTKTSIPANIQSLKNASESGL